MIDVPGGRPWRVAVANRKGGVGKTTVALNLAAAINDSSGSVLVLDADPQQSATYMAGRGPLPFEVRSALSPAARAGIGQIQGYDTVLLDLPGNLDDTEILGEVLAVADFAILPFVPEAAAVQPTIDTAAYLSGVPYRVLFNMVDPLRGPGPVEQARELFDAEGLPYFGSFIRRYVAHSQAQLDGMPITGYRGDRSWRPALDDVRRVQVELLIDLGRLAKVAERT